MKILVICQYYYPEPFRINDICEELVKRGHSVNVVTGLPNYPMGKIYQGYQHGEKRNEIINGVNVHRCFTIGRSTGVMHRLFNYYSYALSSTRYVARLGNVFDLIFVNQLSPVIMANAGIKYKKMYHKKLVLYCLDLWPESLVAGGIERESFLYKYFYKVSKKIYKQADKILITSQMFRKYFKDEFKITDNIEYLPQYAESQFTPEQCRKRPNGFIDLMFAGNVGFAQSVVTIIRTAYILRDIQALRWHVVGDGSELENCKRLAQKLGVNSVIFYGRKPIEEMPKYYAIADAMLVTMQASPVLSMTLPGKVQTYMAAGKPIIGAIDGEASKVILDARCGYCAKAENVNKLVESVRDFCSLSPREIQNLQNNSQSFYKLNFNREFILNEIEKHLGNC